VKKIDLNVGRVEEELVEGINVIKVTKDLSKSNRAYNIVKNELEAETYLIKKFNAKYFETKYVTDRYTGRQLEVKIYFSGKNAENVLLIRKDLPDVAENLIGGGVNKDHYNFGEFDIKKFDDINLENNKLHEHVIWIE
ncbi:hypothetical protein, partial [Flavobacterium columnare]